MVGVFDSGVGGLTALAALRRAAPLCDILYLGDTARVPYGGRDAATVCRYAAEALSYLSAFSPTAVLVACGTVSSVFLPEAPPYPFPLVGIVEAGARAAVAAAPSGRVAVLGTEATVRSGRFASRIRALVFPRSVRTDSALFMRNNAPSAVVRATPCNIPDSVITIGIQGVIGEHLINFLWQI